jgi:hypothetical protein
VTSTILRAAPPTFCLAAKEAGTTRSVRFVIPSEAGDGSADWNFTTSGFVKRYAPTTMSAGDKIVGNRRDPHHRSARAGSRSSRLVIVAFAPEEQVEAFGETYTLRLDNRAISVIEGALEMDFPTVVDHVSAAASPLCHAQPRPVGAVS